MDKCATTVGSNVIEVKASADLPAAIRSHACVKRFAGMLPEKKVIQDAERRFAATGPGEYALLVAIHRPHDKSNRTLLARWFGHSRSGANMWKLEPYRRNGYNQWAHCLAIMRFRYSR